jgi:Zn-dependent protease
MAPVLALALLFALYGARTGISVVLAAMIGAVGGTASLLVHELGHVQAARNLAGIRTASVSLIWFGAATRFEGSYLTGREQSQVAIAGPRASFNMAIAFGAMSLLPLPVAYSQAVLLLALFNVAIGLLNLVPAYPLDGHKLAVGLLWSATGSEKTARKIIRRIGLAWAAVEMPAIAVLIIEKPVIGLGLAFVGACFYLQKWFVRRSAKRVALPESV